MRLYHYLYELEPFTVEPDSIVAIIAIVPAELKESNGELVRTLAEIAATGNAVYNELRDVRNLRGSTRENTPSLYIVRLVEMKLRLEDLLNKYHRQEKPDTNVLIEIHKCINPTWQMGKYNPTTLRGLLKFLLKNEWESSNLK